MKKKLMVALVMVATMIVGTGVVLAGRGPGGGLGGPPSGMETGQGLFDGRMVKILNLTDAQQTQIKAILNAENEKITPRLDKKHESRTKLMHAAETAVFDEVAVRAIASEQVATEIELIVSRIKVLSQINALLTTEQRELLENFAR